MDLCIRKQRFNLFLDYVWYLITTNQQHSTSSSIRGHTTLTDSLGKIFTHPHSKHNIIRLARIVKPHSSSPRPGEVIRAQSVLIPGIMKESPKRIFALGVFECLAYYYYYIVVTMKQYRTV